MDSDTSIIVSAILGLIFIIFLAVLGGNQLSKSACLTGYENYQPQYGFITGCRIMHDGKLTPIDIVREIQ